MDSVEFDKKHFVPVAADLSGGLLSVFDRWQKARANHWAPSWNAYQMESLPPKVIPWCAVVDVLRDPPDFAYRFWGTERANLQGQELTGKPLSEFEPAQMAELLAEELVQVTESRQPLFFRKRHTPPNGSELRFESLRVPLSEDGERVTMVFSVAEVARMTAANYDYFGTELPIEKGIR